MLCGRAVKDADGGYAPIDIPPALALAIVLILNSSAPCAFASNLENIKAG